MNRKRRLEGAESAGGTTVKKSDTLLGGGALVEGFKMTRCRKLNDIPVGSTVYGKGPVLYWMSRDQRVQGQLINDLQIAR